MVIFLLGLSCASSVARDTGTGDTGQPGDTADSGEHTGDSDTAGNDTGETGDTGPPQDLDADGFDSNDDCDDLDPTRHPGATEYCDGKDHDCDGEANEGTRCSDLLVPDAMLAGRIDGSAGAIVDDVTGDGLADIDVWGAVDTTAAGSPYTVIYAQGTLSGVGPRTDVYELPGLRVHWTAPYCDAGGGSATGGASGDVDGDGLNDLAVVSQVGTCDGGVPILFGPFAMGAAYDLGDATSVWRPTDADLDILRWGEWGHSRRKGDFNADGLTDNLVTGASDNYVFFGGEYSTGGSTEAMHFSDQCNSGDAGLDVDGDGVDDLVVLTHEGEALMVSGADVHPGSVDIRELARLRVAPTATGDVLSYLTSPELLGDLDGDGYGELVVLGADGRGECGDDCEELLFFSGAQTGDTDGFGSVGSYISYPNGFLRQFANNADFDFDGDGLAEMTTLTRDEDGVTQSCILSGSLGVPAGPAEPLPSPRLCFDYGDRTALIGGPDTNGDGFDDVLVGWDSDPSGGSHYVSDLLLGFAVPWDDPAYW